MHVTMQGDGMIALSAATAGIAAAGVLLASRRAGDPAERALLAAVFAFFAGVVALPLIVAFARVAYVFYLPLVLPMFLALSPAIYLYVSARTAANEQSFPSWRHGVLPLLGLAVAIGYWLLPAEPRATMFVDGEMPPGLAPQILAGATFALIAVWALASLGYLIASLKRLGSFRTRLKDLYSNTDRRELRWIDWLMGFLSILWATSAATLMSDNFGPGLIFSGELVLAITAALLLFLIAFSVASSPTADEGAAVRDQTSETQPSEKYARSALSPTVAAGLAARIETAMRQDELYLDPNLSLGKLAAHVRAAPNDVSQTLNERLEATFFDYIAHWRVEAAKKQLLTGSDSILTVAIDVGFNSRSTFYKAFKRETGVTPKAFRDDKKTEKPTSVESS